MQTDFRKESENLNEHYQKALSKGIAIAYGANGDTFIKSLCAMTADMTEECNRRKHRKKQTVKVKGIYGGAVIK